MMKPIVIPNKHLRDYYKKSLIFCYTQPQNTENKRFRIYPSLGEIWRPVLFLSNHSIRITPVNLRKNRIYRFVNTFEERIHHGNLMLPAISCYDCDKYTMYALLRSIRPICPRNLLIRNKCQIYIRIDDTPWCKVSICNLNNHRSGIQKLIVYHL